MRYLLKQKIWSFTDDFVIRDAEQNEVFHIEGKFFSWGDKLSFRDRDGQELAYISQKLLSLLPRYEIYRNGDLFAEVMKELSWFKSHFTLDVPGPNDYTIRGSFLSHEYTFERAGREVARVSKAYFAWSDTYGVDIVDGEDDVAILATCIVIDLVNHDDKND